MQPFHFLYSAEFEYNTGIDFYIQQKEAELNKAKEIIEKKQQQLLEMRQKVSPVMKISLVCLVIRGPPYACS